MLVSLMKQGVELKDASSDDIDKALEAYNAKSSEKRVQKKTIFEVVV